MNWEVKRRVRETENCCFDSKVRIRRNAAPIIDCDWCDCVMDYD
ncbi:MAG: hypothetical protein ACKPAE_09710 [Microcystis panniformis]